MAKTEKKVIAIIVEGPTDEDALYGIADDMSDDEKMDITLLKDIQICI